MPPGLEPAVRLRSSPFRLAACPSPVRRGTLRQRSRQPWATDRPPGSSRSRARTRTRAERRGPALEARGVRWRCQLRCRLPSTKAWRSSPSSSGGASRGQQRRSTPERDPSTWNRIAQRERTCPEVAHKELGGTGASADHTDGLHRCAPPCAPQRRCEPVLHGHLLCPSVIGATERDSVRRHRTSRCTLRTSRQRLLSHARVRPGTIGAGPGFSTLASRIAPGSLAPSRFQTNASTASAPSGAR